MSETKSLENASADPALLHMTADIVSAFVTRNSLPTSELPAFIALTYASLTKVVTGAEASTLEPVPHPAVPIKKSVGKDYIICLEDGLKFKSLRRHLAAKFNMTPDEYRKKWGLPHDYPMVAPEYASARSELAKKFGLGQIQPERRAASKSKKKAA